MPYELNLNRNFESKRMGLAMQDLEYLTKSIQRNCNGGSDNLQTKILSPSQGVSCKRANSNAPNYYDTSIKCKHYEL